MSSCSEPQSKGTVLITGAASGIGKATAELFAQRGWCCVLLDRDLERLWQLKSQLVSSNHQKHLCRVLDLTDPAAIQSLGQDLPELDALINNAGMSDSGASALEPVDEEVPARLMALNLAAPARMVQAYEPAHALLTLHLELAFAPFLTAVCTAPVRPVCWHRPGHWLKPDRHGRSPLWLRVL